jgi:hypothetical protein
MKITKYGPEKLKMSFKLLASSYKLSAANSRLRRGHKLSAANSRFRRGCKLSAVLTGCWKLTGGDYAAMKKGIPHNDAVDKR